MERRCSKCLTFKPIDQFGNDKKGKDGKSYRCKECAKIAATAHYKANHEHGIQVRRDYYQSHKEQNSINCRQYRDSHRDQLKEYQKQWRIKNADKLKAMDRAKYLKRREAALAWQKEYVKKNQASYSAKKSAYYRANKPKIRAQIQAWYNNKRNTDPAFRVLCALRRRLTHAIMGNNKSARTIELLGCEIPILMAHLEARFTEGMTWQNYGAWQIDHVRPCALFPLHTEEGQRACFHYTNLQPLWKQHNQSKGKRFNSASAAASNPVPTPPQSGSFPDQPQPLSPV